MLTHDALISHLFRQKAGDTALTRPSSCIFLAIGGLPEIDVGNVSAALNLPLRPFAAVTPNHIPDISRFYGGMHIGFGPLGSFSMLIFPWAITSRPSHHANPLIPLIMFFPRL